VLRAGIISAALILILSCYLEPSKGIAGRSNHARGVIEVEGKQEHRKDNKAYCLVVFYIDISDAGCNVYVSHLYTICNYENIVNLEDTMAKTAIIQTRVEPAVKQNAQKILNALNISMSEAISIYLAQIALHKGIPFEIKIPNLVTEKTLKYSENGKELHKVSNVDELFQELDS